MPLVEYKGIDKIFGPFVMLPYIDGIGYNDIVEVYGSDGTPRRGRAVMISNKATLIQVFKKVDGLIPDDTKVRFEKRGLEMQLSPSILGRTFNGLGEPRDGCGMVLGGIRRDVNGSAINPVARIYPHDFICTGISVIDTLTTLIRGQKLPIFSGDGLPHNQLAIQIATQSRLVGSENFAVVFAGIGIRHDDAATFVNSLSSSRSEKNLVLFLNLADDPVIERISTPRMALTAAEYLAFELDKHVLVILTDMTSYCEALRELSITKGEIPSRKGYPAYLYSDLATLYERAGVVKGRPGSVTMLPILTMPNDDITHPIPDLTGFITEGQMALSRALDARGVYPPIDPLSSLSRLMKDGIGSGRTREDHSSLSSQLFAAYSRNQDVKALAEVVGKDELSEINKTYLKFGDAFESIFLNQEKNENREVEKSLDIGWKLLSTLPTAELTRVKTEEIEKYIKNRV